MTAPPPNTPILDGRRARGQRTRAAVVEALMDLVREGELKPTGARIAARAGISVRALWSNFTDLEAVYDATGRELVARQDERSVAVPADLPLAERITRFCGQRAEFLEVIAPFGRANRIREPFSAVLRRNRKWFIERITAEIEQVFDEELTRAGPHRGDYVAVLTASCSWTWWSVLRDDLELDVDRAVDLMRLNVGSVLASAVGGRPAPEPADGDQERRGAKAASNAAAGRA